MTGPSVIVVGGGLIGLSVAEHLSRDEARVTVLDQGEFGREASWAGAGMLPLHSAALEGEGFLGFCRLSYDLYPDWVKRLEEEGGVPCEMLESGGLGLLFDEQEESMALSLRKKISRRGVDCELLTAAKVRKMEPAVPGLVRSGFFFPQTRQMRPPRLLSALLSCLKNRGVPLRPVTKVEDLHFKDRRVAGVRHAGGVMEADAVVLASGAWAARLGATAGLSIPVKPLKGQVQLFGPSGPRPFSRVLFGLGMYLVPRKDGRIYAGSTMEDVGFEKKVEPSVLQGLVERAVRMVPALGTAPTEAQWAGLRPASPDGMPFLGSVPSVPGLFLAVGHHTHGHLLAPATGRLLAQAVLGRRTDLDLTPYRLDRPFTPAAPPWWVALSRGGGDTGA